MTETAGGEGALAISLDETVKRMSVSRAWLYGPTGPLASGELPTLRLGKRRLVRVVDLEAFLARRVAQSGGIQALDRESSEPATDAG